MLCYCYEHCSCYGMSQQRAGFSCCKAAVLNNAILWRMCIYNWAWCNTPEDLNHQQYNCDHLRTLHNVHTLVFFFFKLSEFLFWANVIVLCLHFWKYIWQDQKLKAANWSCGNGTATVYLTELVFDFCVTVHHWYNNGNSQLDVIIIFY